MNGQNNENLKDLFGKFLDPKQAQEAAEDIYKAKQLFNQHPAPEPDHSFIANIKAEVQKVVLRKKMAAFRMMVYKTAAVAAAVVISITTGVKLLEKKTNIEKTVISSTASGTTDKNNYIAADDNHLEILFAEADQIGDEITALHLNENGDNEYGDVTELEINFTEINADFWKG